MKNLSELYIDEMVDSLINDHAAVLIGAGFSRNADPANKFFNEKMPLWTDLTDLFCDKLGIPQGAARNYLDPLTLAQEVEDSYGRPFLDKLIRTKTVDDHYLPSDIHINLLNLPWTDVFTTNYDTLLERASAQIPNRNYLVVADQKDLLYSAGRHRIVKLHGSFPSNGPFIITKEDFRTYPQRNAAFINTVQQSLLENTMYLIGFSGDDPNFLNWIGWIHDNLGIKNSPKIYLINHESMSPVKIQRLAALNIEPIILNEIAECKDSDIKDSFCKFLRILSSRVESKGKALLKWPAADSINLKYSEGKEKEYYEGLRKIHLSYPGWLIIPRRQRRIPMFLCQKDIWFYFRAHEKRPLEFQISYELCWIRSMLGIPLTRNDLGFLERIIERHSKTTDKYEYHYVLMTMLYSYRMLGMEDKWEWCFKLLQAEDLNSDESNSLIYEDIWHDIYSFQYCKIEKKIEGIVADKENAEWVLKKGGLLALLGRKQDAENIIKECLFSIRSGVGKNPGIDNLRYLSIESCLVSLYNYILQARDLNNKSKDKESEIAKDYTKDFIWSQENEFFENSLTDGYAYVGNESEQYTYDIGRISHVSRYGIDSDAINAFMFLRFREQTGIPFRIGNVTYKKGLLGASKRLAPYTQNITPVLGILAADKKIITEGCSRKYFLSMSLKTADNLCNILVDSLLEAMDSILERRDNKGNNDIYRLLLKVMPELISRLCPRCSSELFEKIGNLLIKLYNFQDYIELSGVKELTRRYIQNIPIDMLLSEMRTFWTYPLMDKQSWTDLNFPDPFIYISSRLSKYFADRSQKDVRIELPDEYYSLVDNLLESINNPLKKKSVIRRLTYIASIYSLNEHYLDLLRDIILKEDNLDNNGIPYIGDFYPAAIEDIIPLTEKLKRKTEKSDCWYRIIQETFCDNEYLSSSMGNVIGKIWTHALSELDNSSIKKAAKYLEGDLDNLKILVTRYPLSSFGIQSLCSVISNLNVKLKLDIGDELIIRESGTKELFKECSSLLAEALVASRLLEQQENTYLETAKDLCAILENNEIPHALLKCCVDLDNDNRESILMNQLFSGNMHLVEDARIAIGFLHKYQKMSFDRIIDYVITALITSVDYHRIYHFAYLLCDFVEKDEASSEQCNRFSRYIEKYTRMTELNECDTEVDLHEKLIARESISALAHSLYLFYKRHEIDLPPQVEKWREIGQSPEEYFEIRQYWENGLVCLRN